MRGRKPVHPDPIGRGHVYRRYSNRRYYSVEEHCYVNCSALLGRGKLVVIDAKTGRDITEWAVAAAKLEKDRRKLEKLAKKMGFA